jgi:lysyl-tRNA synthetase class I
MNCANCDTANIHPLPNEDVPLCSKACREERELRQELADTKARLAKYETATPADGTKWTPGSMRCTKCGELVEHPSQEVVFDGEDFDVTCECGEQLTVSANVEISFQVLGTEPA